MATSSTVQPQSANQKTANGRENDIRYPFECCEFDNEDMKDVPDGFASPVTRDRGPVVELDLAYALIQQLKTRVSKLEKECLKLTDANKKWEKFYLQQKEDRQPANGGDESQLLKEQLKIYKDDFSMERRDRVRAVMEIKHLRIENEKLRKNNKDSYFRRSFS